MLKVLLAAHSKQRLSMINLKPPLQSTILLIVLLLGFSLHSKPQKRILIFYKTAGFYHKSIPAAIKALLVLGKENNIVVDTTTNATWFKKSTLKNYQAVVFLSTTGDVLNEKQQLAFQKYIRSGKGYVGIHSATSTERDWPWYNKLAGAYLDYHPEVQKATINVIDKTHPATSFLPEKWERVDEWYNFKSISPEIKVLATLDESSYKGGINGPNHPIAWYQEFEGGRAFYTAGGHTDSCFSEPLFLKHLLGGIFYAINMIPQDSSAQIRTGSVNTRYLKNITSIKGLVALWDFKEETGQNREAYGLGKFPLREVDGGVERVNEGPLSGYSALFTGTSFLRLLNSETGKLNIHGKKQAITVMAWVKWNDKTGFVGGMWNEYQDGGKRQYGLFVSLTHYNGANQVCGHISRTGKPTPPFPYSIDYSASKQSVEKNKWQLIAFTYDGGYMKSYLNGKLERREPELIDNTKDFKGYPNGLIQSKNPYYYPYGIGNNGSDFTVGAVLLHSCMGNFFRGQIGGLAVFNRALTEHELVKLNNL
jgi:type 1 glutamine amidotransferase